MASTWRSSSGGSGSRRSPWKTSTPLARAQAARALVDLGRDDPCVRAVGAEDGGDGAAAGAEVNRDAMVREALHGPERQLLALPARDVDAVVDLDLDAAEGDAAGDPRKRLAGEAPGDQHLEPRCVTARAGQQLVGLLLGGHKAAGLQPRDQRGALLAQATGLWAGALSTGVGRLGSQRCSSGGPFSGNGTSMRSKSRGTSVRGEDRARLVADLAAGVARGDVGEREQADAGLGGQLGGLARGRVAGLQRAVALLGGERRLVDEHVGAIGGHTHHVARRRVAREHELASVARLAPRPARARTPLTDLAALQPPEVRAGRNAELGRQLGVEAAGTVLLDQRVPEGARRGGGRGGRESRSRRTRRWHPARGRRRRRRYFSRPKIVAASCRSSFSVPGGP